MLKTNKAQQFLAQRRTAYHQTFRTSFGEQVLEDLSKFCRAHESTFHADPRVHAVLEGRREVFLRIMEHLQFTDDQLYDLHGLKTVSNDPSTNYDK